MVSTGRSLGSKDAMDPGTPSCLATGKSSPMALPGNQFTSEVSIFLALLRRMAIQLPHVPGHGHRTASYALPLGESVGLSSSDLTHLHYAALLHDIGQLTLPEEILNKNGPLSAEEYELFQCHPRAGAKLLQPISFLRVPAIWIAHHHERWDGWGYPYGLRGNFIPLGSRILAVADTFDAMTANSSYGWGQSWESAVRLLGTVAGSQLDPELVEVFIGLVPGKSAEVPTTAAPATGRIHRVGLVRPPTGRGAYVPPGPRPPIAK